MSDVREPMAAKLISQRFTSPAHLGANKTHQCLAAVLWILFSHYKTAAKSTKCPCATTVNTNGTREAQGSSRAGESCVLPVALGYSGSSSFKCFPHKPALWPWNSWLRLFRSAPVPSQLLFLGQAAGKSVLCNSTSPADGPSCYNLQFSPYQPHPLMLLLGWQSGENFRGFSFSFFCCSFLQSLLREWLCVF